MSRAYQSFYLDLPHQESHREAHVELSETALRVWPEIVQQLRDRGYIVLLGMKQIACIHTEIILGFKFGDQVLGQVKDIFYELVRSHSLPFRSGSFFMEEPPKIDDLSRNVTEPITVRMRDEALRYLRDGRVVHGIVAGMTIELRVVKIS
ncbi:MAG: hypothetical protein AAB372_04350 [Patescibacteria group bacterium]|mgnify:CR=1 FL=1